MRIVRIKAEMAQKYYATLKSWAANGKFYYRVVEVLAESFREARSCANSMRLPGESVAYVSSTNTPTPDSPNELDSLL